MASDFMRYVSDDLNARQTTHELGQRVEHRRRLPRVRHSEEFGWELPQRESENNANFVEKLEKSGKGPSI